LLKLFVLALLSVVWMLIVCLQSTGIKKGSKGDVSVLQPTLMTAVPVSSE